jgi:UDPglucose 6-dehydrogenase
MRVAVLGSGYVGLVLGAGLAETGNHVLCADIDAGKIATLHKGRLPIYEPGLQPLVERNTAAGRLEFTTDVGAAVETSDVVFIAVGTPADEDGSADLQHVLSAARTIGDHMNGPKVVITKSTVPVGTARMVREAIAQRTTVPFYVCSNPEFLKEGAAVEDFMKPDRVIVGVEDGEARAVLEELYAPFVRTGNPLIFMDLTSAEMTKYAANAMLATRISFMNQIAELCEAVGADVSLVRRGVGSDPRIGSAFLFPGPGYGGSCFPKDVQALVRTAESQGVSLDLLKAVEAVNQRQKRRVVEKLVRALDGSVKGRRVAVWGLAFKAETDDVRESPALAVVRGLLDGGASVAAHDPQALDQARRVLGDRIDYVTDPYEALRDADALAIMTEWLAFRNPDFDLMKARLRRPILVDGRNLYDPAKMRRLGFRYFGIGRGERA